MDKTTNRLFINIGLLITGMFTVSTGMLIQIKYHMGNHGNIALHDSLFGIQYPGWSVIHKTSIVLFSLFMVYHLYVHWKLYKTVVKKRLLAKNQQVLILSIFFVFSAVTGLTSWVIDMFSGSQMQRKMFIEIHDKLAIILSVYLILHVIKKYGWFVSAFRKLVSKHSF